jgi:pyruvate/2-oxoglutarate dehydrogenase complex dihydrolipoamide acyltransferase (E2) component
MLWLFDVPHGEPYVMTTVDFRWERALAWIDAQNAREGVRVTTQHVFTSAVGRLFREFPEINARIFDNVIHTLPTVDIVMPVNLLGSGVDRELSMVVIRNVDELNPRQVAERLRPQVQQEREGKTDNAFLRTMLRFGSRSPGVLRFALSQVATLAHDRRGAALLSRSLPMSTLITNVGAALAEAPGLRFRAVAFSPPSKLIHVGSVFGVGPLERAAVVEGKGADERIVVGTVLPVGFMFDHRLVDGVKAGRILTRLNELVQDPAATWGEAC